MWPVVERGTNGTTGSRPQRERAPEGRRKIRGISSAPSGASLIPSDPVVPLRFTTGYVPIHPPGGANASITLALVGLTNGVG